MKKLFYAIFAGAIVSSLSPEIVQAIQLDAPSVAAETRAVHTAPEIVSAIPRDAPQVKDARESIGRAPEIVSTIQRDAPVSYEFSDKVKIAIVSALLSLLGGYILLLLKERREPKKRLSYNLEVRRGLLGVEESIARFVQLTYKGCASSNLTYIRCDVKNTGKSVVKDQYLRFQFDESSNILDYYTDPLPPKEFGVAEAPDSDQLAYEKRFKIEHLEKEQQVNFRFVINGPPEREVKIFPYNAEGDVEVTAASISRAADDRKSAELFVFFFILTEILPPLFRWLPSFLADATISILYAFLGVAIFPFIKPFARIVSTALVTFARSTNSPELSVSHVVQEKGAVFNIVTGGVATLPSESSTKESTPSEDISV